MHLIRRKKQADKIPISALQYREYRETEMLLSANFSTIKRAQCISSRNLSTTKRAHCTSFFETIHERQKV